MGSTYLFYMTGGHVIKVKGVKSFEAQRSEVTGKYTGYKIIFIEGAKPEFISLSIPDIVAITCM